MCLDPVQESLEAELEVVEDEAQVVIRRVIGHIEGAAGLEALAGPPARDLPATLNPPVPASEPVTAVRGGRPARLARYDPRDACQAARAG